MSSATSFRWCWLVPALLLGPALVHAPGAGGPESRDGTAAWMPRLAAGAAWAQSANGQGDERRVRRDASMGAKVHEKLAAAQELTESQQYAAALQVLEDLRNGRKKLNDYELASVWNLYGFIHYSQENYAQAERAYQAALRQERHALGLGRRLALHPGAALRAAAKIPAGHRHAAVMVQDHRTAGQRTLRAAGPGLLPSRPSRPGAGQHPAGFRRRPAQLGQPEGRLVPAADGPALPQAGLRKNRAGAHAAHRRLAQRPILAAALRHLRGAGKRGHAAGDAGNGPHAKHALPGRRRPQTWPRCC